MQRNLFPAFRLSEPGASARCLPGDRNSPCRLPALHRVCRKPPQDDRALPPLPANRTSRAHRRSEEHTSELQSLRHLVCRLLLEKKKNTLRKCMTLLDLITPRQGLTYTV